MPPLHQENNLAKNLLFLRRRNRINQTELASRVNKRSTTISNWENKLSEPNVQELIEISNFFGVSLDDLVMGDFENGKVFTSPTLEQKQQNGKVNGKVNGKLSAEKEASEPHGSPTQEPPKEPGDSAFWAVLSALRLMDGKLDGLRAVVDSINEKTGSKPA